MPRYGLGNYLYDIEVKDGGANFNFFDPEDAANTAEVSVAQKDFPAGVSQADSRQVAELAFAQCAKQLNDARDARLKKQAADAHEKQVAEDARVREAAADFLNNAQDVVTEPKKVDEDGTRVYNTEAPVSDNKPDQGDKKK